MLQLNHKKLNVWKEGINLVKLIYKTTESFPRNEIFGLSNQLRRASVSVASNIAEGASRRTKAERIRFYEISRSSVVEIDTQLEIANELKLINEDQLKELDNKISHIFSMLSNLIKNCI
ncbi:MAG: four helix bundle protein [Ignavibacteriae bacterium]|nr:four helix bundle protein [Ignavibacteriota bacterium]